MNATIRAALATWIRSATGLDQGHVIWSQQAGPRPSGPFVSMRLSVRSIGQGWLQTEEVDDPDPGEELEYHSRGSRECLLRLQAFAGIDGSPVGASSPLEMLEACVIKAALPVRAEALSAAGIGMADFGSIQVIDGVIGSSSFDPRATLDVRFFATSSASEFGTYIESVEVENQIPDPDTTEIIDLDD